jgi:dihydrofolate synthase/folylpolyglutamate synthase
VTAILRAVLEAVGYSVHVYTSPHLVRFNERITLAGQEIEDGPLEALIDEALALNEGRAVTFFEITTAMAFAAFARTPADICLLEVGMGGRLDCTNVIGRPLVTLISAISGDHKEFLGETLDLIAAEKAGIFKPDCPALTGYQTEEAMQAGVTEVFERLAAEKGVCDLLMAGQGWQCSALEDGKAMRLTLPDGRELTLPRPALEGAHQIENAGLALSALSLCRDFPVTTAQVETGLRSVRWPARLQKIAPGALPCTVPAGWDVYLDGGHNDSAGAVLARQAQIWHAEDGRDLHIILGMLDKKDPAAFLAPLLPHAASLSVMKIPGPSAAESLSAQQVQALTQYPAQELTGETPAMSLTQFFAAHKNEAPARVLICGSLYLAGAVLAICAPQEEQKKAAFQEKETKN